MSRDATYTHPKKLDADHARRLSRLFFRKNQTHAFQLVGERWYVMCPIEDEEIVVDLIEKAKEL